MSGTGSAPSLAQQQAQQAMMMGMGGPKQMPVPYLMQQVGLCKTCSAQTSVTRCNSFLD